MRADPIRRIRITMKPIRMFKSGVFITMPDAGKIYDNG
jgi:hypothetical protein